MQKVKQFFHDSSFTYIDFEMCRVKKASAHFHALCLSNNTSLQYNNIQDEIRVNHMLQEEETETILPTSQDVKGLFYPVIRRRKNLVALSFKYIYKCFNKIF